MDNIKLFAKNEKGLKTVIHAVRLYSQDIGVEFCIEKFVMLVMKSGKWHLTDGMKLQNKDKFRTLGEKEKFKNLGILVADTIKQVERKVKKWRKNILGEVESYLRQNYVAESLSKE